MVAMQIVANGLLTNYWRRGAARQVLILHGWADSSVAWQQFAAKLSKKYDVVVPDLPGFGNSQAPKTAWGLNDYAAFIGVFLEKANVQPYAIIGHSNGGAIAIRGLANRDFVTGKLVLLASAGIRGEYKGRNKALRMVAKSGKLLAKPLPAATQRHLKRKVYQTIGSDMLVAEHLQETFKKVISDDVRSDASKLSLPTLLVYGDNDEQTPFRYGEIFSQLIAGSKLEVLPGAGHFVHLDKPVETIGLVEEFLS